MAMSFARLRDTTRHGNALVQLRERARVFLRPGLVCELQEKLLAGLMDSEVSCPRSGQPMRDMLG